MCLHSEACRVVYHSKSKHNLVVTLASGHKSDEQAISRMVGQKRSHMKFTTNITVWCIISPYKK